LLSVLRLNTNARRKAPSGLAALCVRLSEMAEKASRNEDAKELLTAVEGVRDSLLFGQ